MLKYIGKRILLSLATLFIILTLLFFLLEFMPGSPFNDEKLNATQKEQIYKKYGLDKPLVVRYGTFLKNVALQGDFGSSYSIQQNYPVNKLIGDRFGVSIALGLQALIFGAIIGTILGIIAGVKRNTIFDTLTTAFSVLGVSIPSYVFALGITYWLGYSLKLFPITYDVYDPFRSTILPTISLSMFVIATVSRFMRTELVEVLSSEYITLAEAKGVSAKGIILRHSLRNALIPVITVLGPLTVSLMTGSLVIEKIFGIPGIGSLLVTAISVNDFNVILGIAFFYSLFYILMMLFIDIMYGVIDPRIRVGGESDE